MTELSAITLLERAKTELLGWLDETERSQIGADTELLLKDINEYLKNNDKTFIHHWYECTNCNARICLQAQNDNERCYMCGATMNYQRTVKGVKQN